MHNTTTTNYQKRTNYLIEDKLLKYAATHLKYAPTHMMRQLYFITAFLALCSCIQLASLGLFMARSTTYESTESAGVSVATFICDVDDCTFEGNCSKSLKRHKLTHSAALLHCDFMGCSYETKDSSNLKRHKLSQYSADRGSATSKKAPPLRIN